VIGIPASVGNRRTPLPAAWSRWRARFAGEGGCAWGRVARDKDGILAGCLLAELVATTAAPLRARLRELQREHGRSASGRIALPADDRARRGLSALRGALPSQVDGARVLDCDESDGLHLTLEDGFLMIRASGTEPVLRIYAEARGPRLLSRRLRIGAGLLARAARRGGRGS
jgi:phosphomannomutase